MWSVCRYRWRNFYPRPPRGGRPSLVTQFCSFVLFLSTPSARRATPFHFLPRRTVFYFYPRPPRGGRPAPEHLRRNRRGISIHALREEGDSVYKIRIVKRGYFYPRPPRGGRQELQEQQTEEREISIHALREEGDTLLYALADKEVYFYPRPPRGGRQIRRFEMQYSQPFLSTPSARRATRYITLFPMVV